MENWLIEKLQEEEDAKQEKQVPLFLDLPIEPMKPAEELEEDADRGVFVIDVF